MSSDRRRRYPAIPPLERRWWEYVLPGRLARESQTRLEQMAHLSLRAAPCICNWMLPWEAKERPGVDPDCRHHHLADALRHVVICQCRACARRRKERVPFDARGEGKRGERTDNIGVCTLCPWFEHWLSGDAADCATAWHVYEAHRDAWRAFYGDTPPTEPRPEAVGEKWTPTHLGWGTLGSPP